MVRIPYQEKTVDAEEMDFDLVSQSIGIYELKDGTKIQLSHVPSTIYKLIDEKAPDGSVVYVVRGTVKMAVLRS